MAKVQWLWAGSVAAMGVAALCAPSLIQGCDRSGPGSGDQFTLRDEAAAAGKKVEDFPEEDSDIWKYMDGDTPAVPGQHKVMELDSDQIKGRNTWLMWCGGNEAFWDYFANHSYGLCDLLRILDSRTRAEGKRFATYGLMPEPGFRATRQPGKYAPGFPAEQAAKIGLYLDERVDAPESKDPKFYDVYGYPSGIVGLRLFPNPAFKGDAAARWNAERYYTDPTYYEDRSLVRPYRVGMACAFCHVGPHPLYPPENPEEPKWENLSSCIGSQYFKVAPIFASGMGPGDFPFQLLRATRPGTLDTSLIPTDYLNNPNTMNAIFQVGPRLARSLVTPAEKLAAPALAITADAVALHLPGDSPAGERHTPHVLVDGADSIGISGALDRVFINIGTFHQYWIECQNPLVGGRKQIPFEIGNARKGSVYWQVTEKRAVNLAKFFLKAAKPMHLKDAPGGAEYLKADAQVLERGKIVFAEHCLSCHSSKQPDDGQVRDPFKHAEWARSEEYKAWARAEVMKPDFFEGNYLSVDQRYPISYIKTNANRAMGTNATRGHLWDNFSSEVYKGFPPAGTVTVWDPVQKKETSWNSPGGGPGYYRVPTLVGLWATAPYLHNNALGLYNGDPSVKGRVACFDDGIRKLLWPTKRAGLGSVWTTDQDSVLRINAEYLPDLVNGMWFGGVRAHVFLMYPILLPAALFVAGWWLNKKGRVTGVRGKRIVGGIAAGLGLVLSLVIIALALFKPTISIGPIPKGVPVNLLSNIDMDGDRGQVKEAALKLLVAVHAVRLESLSGDKARDRFMEIAGPALMKVSKCPDFVEDRGHEFGSDLPDADKEALIELLKTF